MLKYLKTANAYTSITAGFISVISIGMIRYFRFEGYEINFTIDMIAIALPYQIGVVGIDTIKASIESNNGWGIGFKGHSNLLTRGFIYCLSAFISGILLSTFYHTW